MSIQVVDFRLNKPNGDKKTLNRMSFIMKKSETESGAQQDIEEALEVSGNFISHIRLYVSEIVTRITC